MNSKIKSLKALDGLMFDFDEHKPRIDKEKKEIEYFVTFLYSDVPLATLQLIKENLQAKEIKTYEGSDPVNNKTDVGCIGLIFDNKNES